MDSRRFVKLQEQSIFATDRFPARSLHGHGVVDRLLAVCGATELRDGGGGGFHVIVRTSVEVVGENQACQLFLLTPQSVAEVGSDLQ